MSDSFPLFLLGKIVKPLVAILHLVSGAAVGALGLKPVEERERAVSVEELEEIVESSSEAGTIEEDESEMLQGVVRFSETLAREVMTPRNDIVFVQASASIAEARDVFVEQGMSRLLVIEGELDNVRGVLIAKDLIPLLGASDTSMSVGMFIREAFTIPCTMHIDDVLEQLKRRAVHFAVVLDEHGGVDGVLTLEDLLEEIVGDIYDEHDPPEEFAEFEMTKGGDLLIDGSSLVDDVNDEYALDLPTGEYDTIAGFIIHHLGRIPEEGELVEYNGQRIKVEVSEQNRISRLRVLDFDPDELKQFRAGNA